MTVDRDNPGCYPVFLKLEGRPCLVVGGGKVACRKVASLLEANAGVTVVSPEAGPEIQRLAAERKITWKRKAFEDTDLEGGDDGEGDGVLLVVGATGDCELNRRIFSLADSAGVLVNIVDQPESCNFLVPSTLSRGPFQIAVSTGGASPLLARRVRERLERSFGPHYREVVLRLAELRPLLKERLPDEKKRREFWDMFIDLDFFDSLIDYREEIDLKLRERVERCLSQLAD
ncbi:MAG: bifunctional precorrin-2 dehydrogenase/sirohydrochlorin ferrochelatase [Gemmatimonadota bacterium]|nr:bifunctional precorrin-2 dehydrogenase/sirohydrochlorin ferrochelatase [Gemmatimonadota bacterium]